MSLLSKYGTYYLSHTVAPINITFWHSSWNPIFLHTSPMKRYFLLVTQYQRGRSKWWTYRDTSPEPEASPRVYGNQQQTRASKQTRHCWSPDGEHSEAFRKFKTQILAPGAGRDENRAERLNWTLDLNWLNCQTQKCWMGNKERFSMFILSS